MATLPFILAALPMLAACVADVRRRIIPDWSVLALAGIGIGAALASGQPAPALLAGAACAAVGAALSIIGLWGWGDAKLLGAAGLLVGPPGIVPFLNIMVITGAALALALILLRPAVLAGRLPLPAGAPRWLVAEHRRLRRAPSVPYGLAIVAGIIAGM